MIADNDVMRRIVLKTHYFSNQPFFLPRKSPLYGETFSPPVRLVNRRDDDNDDNDGIVQKKLIQNVILGAIPTPTLWEAFYDKEENTMARPIETISMEELYYMPIPQKETEMIIEDMIPQGLTILAGPPKSCKSWLVLNMGISVATGTPLLGKEPLQSGVLYFALEDRPVRLQSRVHQLGVDEPPPGMYVATSCPPLGKELLEELNRYLKQHPDIRLIIIDTLQMIRKNDGGTSGTNQYGKDTDDLSMLKKYADDRNLAIVIVHHVTKKIDPHDPVNDVRGSSGMSATPDCILILRKERLQKTGELMCISRDLPQWKMKMLFENFRWQMQELITEEDMAKEEIPDVLYRIADLIRERDHWEGTMSQLLEEIGETEMTSNVLSRRIARFGYEVFCLHGIDIDQTRTSSERRYTFTYHPEQKPNTAEGAGDDGSFMRGESSLSSLSSQMTPQEQHSEAARARQRLLQAGGA